MLYFRKCLNRLLCDAMFIADDVKTWRAIDNPSNSLSLQNDNDPLFKWPQGASMGLKTDFDYISCKQITVMVSLN